MCPQPLLQPPTTITETLRCSVNVDIQQREEAVHPPEGMVNGTQGCVLPKGEQEKLQKVTLFTPLALFDDVCNPILVPPDVR